MAQRHGSALVRSVLASVCRFEKVASAVGEHEPLPLVHFHLFGIPETWKFDAGPVAVIACMSRFAPEAPLSLPQRDVVHQESRRLHPTSEPTLVFVGRNPLNITGKGSILCRRSGRADSSLVLR
jgi:hypothetical protein